MDFPIWQFSQLSIFHFLGELLCLLVLSQHGWEFHDSQATPSADDHAIWLKAPQQLQNEVFIPTLPLCSSWKTKPLHYTKAFFFIGLLHLYCTRIDCMYWPHSSCWNLIYNAVYTFFIVECLLVLFRFHLHHLRHLSLLSSISFSLFILSLFLPSRTLTHEHNTIHRHARTHAVSVWL